MQLIMEKKKKFVFFVLFCFFLDRHCINIKIIGIFKYDFVPFKSGYLLKMYANVTTINRNQSAIYIFFFITKSCEQILKYHL